MHLFPLIWSREWVVSHSLQAFPVFVTFFFVFAVVPFHAFFKSGLHAGHCVTVIRCSIHWQRAMLLYQKRVVRLLARDSATNHHLIAYLSGNGKGNVWSILQPASKEGNAWNNTLWIAASSDGSKFGGTKNLTAPTLIKTEASLFLLKRSSRSMLKTA